MDADAAGWMLLMKVMTVKALQALKRRREVVSSVLDFFRKRDEAAPADLELKVVCNKRARVFCQNLARGLSYAGSRAVCLPSKQQKMSRNNLWKFA